MLNEKLICRNKLCLNMYHQIPKGLKKTFVETAVGHGFRWVTGSEGVI